jgi:glutamine synthetase
MLSAGLKGIEEKRDPPEAIERNIYSLSEKEREKYEIYHLPESLGHALSLMEESELVKNTLGEHVFNNFIHVKQSEWGEYRTRVSPWEINKYLPVL